MTWCRNVAHDVDNRSRKRSPSRWHGPLVAIIEGFKAEMSSLALVEESRQRNRSCKQTQPWHYVREFPWISETAQDTFRKRYRISLRRISKYSEMKFRTRNYSKPISKINPKYQISINAMTLGNFETNFSLRRDFNFLLIVISRDLFKCVSR